MGRFLSLLEIKEGTLYHVNKNSPSPVTKKTTEEKIRKVIKMKRAPSIRLRTYTTTRKQSLITMAARICRSYHSAARTPAGRRF